MTAFRTYFLSSEHPELSVSMRETRAMISDGTTGIHIIIDKPESKSQSKVPAENPKGGFWTLGCLKENIIKERV